MSSLETDAIIAYIASKGIPYRVTDITTPGVHARNSYHYAQGHGGEGLAVDFGGATPGVTPQTSAEMLAIFEAFRPVADKLAELIHNSPQSTVAVKNGKWGNGLALYGGVTWAAHTNHVHVAVPYGTFLASTSPPPAPEVKVKPVFDPPLQIVDFLANPSGPGGWGLGPDGGVFGLGGCAWRGEDHQPLGKDYWAGRHAAKFEPNGTGYTIIATSGERYEYP